MFTGHRRTLAKESDGIMIGLTDQGKTWVAKYFKLIVLLNKILYKNVSGWFRWCFTYDAVYILDYCSGANDYWPLNSLLFCQHLIVR